jgi:hypothetical protein
MHRLQIHDHRVLHLGDLDRRDVVRHQLQDLSCDMDQMHLQHLLLLLPLDVVQNLDVMDHLHRQDVEYLDELQNLDGVHLDVVHLDELHPSGVVADAELRHLLRMDYFQGVVDVEQRLRKRMDYFQGAAHQQPVALQVQLELAVHLESPCMQQLQLMPLVLPHVMPSTLQDQHRALLQVLLQVLD